MNCLLDTHTFLWAITGDSRLSKRAREEFESPSNKLYLSVVSLWEIAIKVALGKLPLPSDTEAFLKKHLAMNSIEVLPVLAAHAFRILTLDAHHRDPFDRMLVAQSMVEGWPVVTGDEAIRRYGIEIIW